MLCCSECFTSSYLKGIINSDPKIGDCDFCNSKSVPVYNPRKLGLIFQNILDLYIVNEQLGKMLDAQIENDFKGKIFSSGINENRMLFLREMISDDYEQYRDIYERKVILKHIGSIDHIVKPLQISWEKFAYEIKTTNRFHIQNVVDLSKIKDLLNRYEKHIPKGRICFRARISDKINGYKIEEMYNPPAEKTKAGRANPTGISYLYLADDAKTTLYEVRASLFDYVTIGEFRIEENIKVINLRGDTYDPIYLSEQGELEDFLIYLPFISKLEQELSKPRRRGDNELDYLPTQYLSEFIKSMGYDGVEYQSSLYSQGYNIAIFNPNKLKCLSVAVHEVESIDLQHRKID